jgi:hypothetical protein
MDKTHKHNFVKMYYRTREKGTNKQMWIDLPDIRICTICFEIRELKEVIQ